MNMSHSWNTKAFGLVLLACMGGCSRGKKAEKNEPEVKKVPRDLFLFFGPPACGKGTLADQLKAENGFGHMSTGNLLRENMGQETELGKKAKVFVDKGELVPDELVNAMVQDWLEKQASGTSPIILDGYPRTVGQAQTLLEILKSEKNSGYRLRVVRFSVSEQEAVDRIVYRVVCSNKNCQKVYSLRSLKPKVEGICDVCGSPLLKRSDDTEEVIRKRYRDYMVKETEMLNLFKQHGVKIDEISAEKSINDVYDAFQKIA